MRGYGGRFRYVFGSPVQKLPHRRVLAPFDFVFRADRTERTLIEHGDAVGNAERAWEFVGDHNDRHLQVLLEQKNQFVEFRGNDRIKSSRWFIEYEDFR